MSDYDFSVPLDTNVTAYSERFDHAAEYLFRELREHCGFERKHERHLQHIKLILINLYKNYCISPSLYTAYHRNKNNYRLIKRYNSVAIKWDATVKIIDSLLKFGYAEGVPGFIDRASGRSRTSRVKATGNLVALLEDRFEFSQTYICRADDEEVIILKNEGKRLIDYAETSETASMRQNLCLINDLYKRHFLGLRLSDGVLAKLSQRLKGNLSEQDSYATVIDYTKVKLKRIFNNSSFTDGGRFYNGWWQGVPSEYRPYIRIDDRPTIEVDYSGYHINLLYAIEHLPLAQEDVYSIDGAPKELRGALKVALQVMLNAENEKKAHSAIQNEFNKEKYRKHINGLTIKGLIAKFQEKHQGISHYFYKGYGVKLQFVDSQIAEQIMLTLAKDGIVTLPLHDSFIVETCYKDKLIHVMKDSIIQQYGQGIDVDADLTAFESDLNILTQEVIEDDLPTSEEEYEEQWVHECAGYRKRYNEWLQLREAMALDD